MVERAFGKVVPTVELPPKPREVGITEIRDRGMGMNQVRDLVENLRDYIDIVKWSSGSQCLFSREMVRSKNNYLTANGIEVSTGGLLEKVVLHGRDAVLQYFAECKDLGFTTVEVSSGMVILSLEDKLNLIRAAAREGLKPKAEVAMAYGIRPGEKVEINADKIIAECEACLEAGAWKVMLEEEGIFENVDPWRTDVVYKVVSRVGLKNLMFEASDVHAFNWLIYNFGSSVNLFIDVSQVTQLACARLGIWGKKDIWGRVAAFRPE